MQSDYFVRFSSYFNGQLFCFFFVFQDNPYLEKMRHFSDKKMKNFDYWSIFHSFSVTNNKFKGFIWVAVHCVYKAQFSAFSS